MKTTVFQMPDELGGKRFGMYAESPIVQDADDTIHGCHYVYNVYVECEGSIISTKYHDSIYNYGEGIRQLDEKALRIVFFCFVTDAALGDMEFSDFCTEMGYDMSDKKAKKVYAACINQLDKFETLFGRIVDDVYTSEWLRKEFAEYKGEK
jgi:hypothetical protein